MRDHRTVYCYILSGLLFLGCFAFGLRLAEHRELWNDEIFTQVSSVDRQSFSDHWFGRIGEGNNAPLFYSMQKTVCWLARYHTPDLWKGQDAVDRVLLRFNPVLFISALIAVIFFYFARYHSVFAGVYSLFITFSTVMVWDHWAEARPYGLWMLLTTVQSLIFLYALKQEKISTGSWRALTAVHFLLSFTIVFSAAQIVIVSFLLWVYREKQWKKYIWLTLIPVCVTVFYYSRAPKYAFWFNLTPDQLVRDCFSRERFNILFMFVFFLAARGLSEKTGFPKKSFPDKVIKEGGAYFWLTVLMLLASFAVIAVFKMGASDGQHGFPIASRYFVYLSPVGIIATTLLSMTILRSLAGNRIILGLLLWGMGYLLIHRFFKTLEHMRIVCAPMFSS